MHPTHCHTVQLFWGMLQHTQLSKPASTLEENLKAVVLQQRQAS
jgi:hypothetical protein